MKVKLPATLSTPDLAPADVARLARVSGGLYVCGAILVLVSLALPHPSSTEVLPLVGISCLAFLNGSLLLSFSERVRPEHIHINLVLASTLVSMCIYFSGIAAGLYNIMFVWVVVVAACVASRTGLACHIAWLMTTYGLALIALEGKSAEFSPVTRFLLTGFALSAAGAAVVRLVEERRGAEARLHREIEVREELQHELEHLAYHDPLTGVANRRRLEEHLPHALENAGRSHQPLCLIAIDLDGFKQYNDLNGHAAGDRLLKTVASLWSGALRSSDLITRMGGDEFLVLLPNCPLGVSVTIAARLRSVMPEGQSCSTGVTTWNGKDSADEFLLTADKALYEIKDSRSSTLAG